MKHLVVVGRTESERERGDEGERKQKEEVIEGE